MKIVFARTLLAMTVATGVMAAPFVPSMVDAMAVQTVPTTTTMKGAIKSISDTTVVVTPSANVKTEVSFALTPAAKRTGALAAGDPVAVTYYYENGQRVVTALAGKAASK